MNGITILIWVTIAIIAVIAIITVKLRYSGEELNEEGSILPDGETMNKIVNKGQNILSGDSNSKQNKPASLSKAPDSRSRNVSFNKIYDDPVVYEVENNNNASIEYESENQVLINYDNTVEKFQEPIKQNQMDIMSQNNNPNNEKHELKDLFTIDELIKESKRKDSERDKEKRSEEDENELSELKESIKKRKENKQEDTLIEEVVDEKEETINDIISSEEEASAESADETPSEEIKTEETSTITTQDVNEVISNASQENEEEVESISESSGITDVLLDKEEETPIEEIKEPILKTPTKVGESKKDYKFGADLDDGEVFGEYDNDLDYRKDLAKITNTIKSSKIFKDVKEKLIQEPEPEPEIGETGGIEESYIRNVNDYEDEFEPIYNETHEDYEATFDDFVTDDFDERQREENTLRILNVKNESPEIEIAEPSIGAIKEKPARDNIKIQMGNTEVVLKKGDEIIFNHLGETYSSQVYAINGDDISVKYRRKNITIKASDVKKVY